MPFFRGLRVLCASVVVPALLPLRAEQVAPSPGRAALGFVASDPGSFERQECPIWEGGA